MRDDYQPPPAVDKAVTPRTVDAAARVGDATICDVVRRSQAGDPDATEALFRYCLPRLTQWARMQMPSVARGYLDAGDVAQDAALRFFTRLAFFEPRSAGEIDAYLRQCVKNRIRDDLRQARLRRCSTDLPHKPPGTWSSPFDDAVAAEKHRRYHGALDRLEREKLGLVLSRLELQWSYARIARRFGKPGVDAARMAVRRALQEVSSTVERGTA